MDDAIRDVMALLNDAEDELSDVDDDDVAGPYYALIEQIKALEVPPATRPRIPPLVVTVPAFDPDNNMLEARCRDALRAECIYEETDLFTAPLSTTNTMAGYLTNVLFHEADFINEVTPDDRIVMYHCNFGRVIYPGYEPPERRATGTRKRKTSKKPRKKQGDGTAFNSQMTFVVRSGLVDEPVYNAELGYSHVPTTVPVYKIKIFRTGVVQLPGALTSKMDDVIDCVQYIADTLNLHLHAGEEDPCKRTRVINTNPVMKNYKFALKIPDDCILDTTMLKRVLLMNPDDALGRIVFDVKYTRRYTKLSVRFSTPLPYKPKKLTCVNIFMRGRVNILGAFEAGMTRRICDYLHTLFTKHRNDLIVPEGGRSDPRWSMPYEPNVATPTDDEIDLALESAQFHQWPDVDVDAMRYLSELIDERDICIERDAVDALNELLCECADASVFVN